jgi:ornithine decarboxylase
MWNRYLPKVLPYYAVKCNPDPSILQWLYDRGSGFDCASAREMVLVKEHCGKQDILFANPCKTYNDIVVGKNLGVSWVTADSSEELEKMVYLNYQPKVLLRIAVDDKGSSSPFSEKFGLQPEDVEKVALSAKNLGLSIAGMSFHVGSGSRSPNAFGNAVRSVLDIWNDLHKKKLTPRNIPTLNLGGGWSSHPKLFQEQAKSALDAVRQTDQLIAEPGRFFAEPTHDLYVRVVGKKPGRQGWRYTLDESVYGQFSCIPFDHAKPRIALIKRGEGSRPKTPAILFGRTCDSLDWIANSESLEELEVGDMLYIPNMGAYTTATGTEFNGFPKPEVIMTDIRPQESELEWLDLTFPLADMLTVGKN